FSQQSIDRAMIKYLNKQARIPSDITIRNDVVDAFNKVKSKKGFISRYNSTHLPGMHTGKFLCDTLIKILADYGLRIENITTCTCDNTTNNDAMFNHLKNFCDSNNIDLNPLKSQVRCLAHVLNLCVQEILKFLKVEPDTDDQYQD
ncbi:unnamed protein product, partial [Allacma fusca]